MTSLQMSKGFNLEWFLKQKEVRNYYLEEPELGHLYVRLGAVTVRNKEDHKIRLNSALHLANFQALHRRKGAFTRLIKRVETASPGLSIFVENLVNISFALKLPEMGFEQVITHDQEFGHFIGSQCFLKRYSNV